MDRHYGNIQLCTMVDTRKPLPLHYLDQRLVYIIDQVEYGVHGRLHIYPLCGIIDVPWHRHQVEGINGFCVSSERHWLSGVKEFAKGSKRPQSDSNQRPLDCQSRALTAEPRRPEEPITY